MSVTYTKINDPVKKNCYEIKFEFEHGDADSYSDDMMIFQNMTEEQLVAYVKKSEEISQMIEDSRSEGTDLPDNFRKLAVSDGFEIPVELDNYAKMNISNYYAASGISEIFYYNENSEKFSVHVKIN
jgi:CRISPR/Cas system-associated protein Csm6